MSLRHVSLSLIRCLGTIWAASTFLFLLPVLMIGRDPARARQYFLRLGPNDDLWQQYLAFLGHVLTLDFGVARTMAPARVGEVVALLLPWSIGLVGVSTLIAGVLGTVLGVALAWAGRRRWVRVVGPLLVMLSALPAYLLGLVLVDLFAFRLRLFPVSGATPTGIVAAPTPGHWLVMLHHAALPAAAIVLTALGFWALSARGLLVLTAGEDALVLAEAKGLRPRRILLDYALRSVIVPQLTALALTLGQVVSGSLLVEIIFGYPGIGTLLYRAIIGFDYNTIHGVVLVVIVAVSLGGLVLDLVGPLLDPRLRGVGR